MSRIIFIASGNHIAKYVHKLQTQLANPRELEIVNTHMEEAVDYAKKQLKDDVDVVIARGNTAKMLKEAKLPFPIVNMPITDFEIVDAIKKAQEKSNKTSPVIGYIGLEDVISNITFFLETLNIKVILYKVTSTEDIEKSISEAQKDQVDILIGGIYTCKLLEKMKIPHVLLESSFSSVKEAYDMAKEMQRNVNLQKKKLEEKNIILDSVSDAIISINQRGKITLFNRVAEAYFKIKQSEVINLPYSIIFKDHENTLVEHVLKTGEKIFGQVIELHDRQYALAINPINVSKRSAGAIISLHEINNIQEIEKNLRKKLYHINTKTQFTFEKLQGISLEILRTIEMGKHYATLDNNLLIIGETGSGKESLAQSIHNASKRKDHPFVIADCSTLSPETIEMEFLGCCLSSSPIKERKTGLFQLSHGGTLYLREISKLPMIGQAKLLKVLKERQIQPIGLQEIIPVDVRIISSCSENLLDKIEQGLFRKDLYHLLNMLLIPLPSLRQRKGDIPHLSNYFIAQNNMQFNRNVTLSKESLNLMEEQCWEVNVLQLKNLCERLVLLSKEEIAELEFVKEQLYDHSYFEHLGANEISKLPRIEEKALSGFVINRRRVTKEELKQLENFYGGNRTLMAKKLGISRSTLWKYMKFISESED